MKIVNLNHWKLYNTEAMQKVVEDLDEDNKSSQAQELSLRTSFQHVVSNNLTEKGIEQLSKLNWKNLQTLKLGTILLK